MNYNNYMIQGEYKFKIYKDGDFYLVDCFLPNGNSYTTQGKTEEEIFEMIADLYLTCYDIQISWWSRFIHRIFRVW